MRLRLLFSESIRSLGANLSTTIAATMTVLIGMFLLGLFIALGSWVVSWSDHVKRELMVKVFFRRQRGREAVQHDPHAARAPIRDVKDYVRLEGRRARADAREVTRS